MVTLRNVASSTSLNWKMKHFYESCTNLDNIETDEGKPLKKIITSLGNEDFFFNFKLEKVPSSVAKESNLVTGQIRTI